MRPVLSEASLLDGLEQAVVVTDLTATIVFWNAAAESLYGWTRDDAIGRPVFEVTPTAASRRQGEEIFEAVRLGRRWSGDYPVQRRDGSTFLAQVTLTPVHDDNGNHVAVLGVSQDVTDARLMEAQAGDSADRLQLAVDAGHLGCWQWTRATGQVRGHAGRMVRPGLPRRPGEGAGDARRRCDRRGVTPQVRLPRRRPRRATASGRGSRPRAAHR